MDMGGALSFVVYSPRSSDHLGSAGSGQPPRVLSSAGYLFTGADEPRREGAQQLEPHVGGLQARVSPSSSEGPFLRAGGSTAPSGPKTLGQKHRRKAIKLVVQPQPIKQPARNSCVPVAVAVCIDTLHRFNHEMEHGKGTFPYKATVPHDLILDCHNAKIWNPGSGSIPTQVLVLTRRRGGVMATTLAGTHPPQHLLALGSWEMHRFPAHRPQHAADLLDNNAAIIGLLWVSPEYHSCDADLDGGSDKVYITGLGWNNNDYSLRLKWNKDRPDLYGWHAVVCFDYRVRDGEMHVLVMDNHSLSGPRRWIHVMEFLNMYTLSVPRGAPVMAGLSG